MSRKQKKKDAREQSTRQLMGIDDITDYGIATRMGELVFFAIKPTNISVLPDAGVGTRIYALLNVVKGMAEIEMLALNWSHSTVCGRRAIPSRHTSWERHIRTGLAYRLTEKRRQSGFKNRRRPEILAPHTRWANCCWSRRNSRRPFTGCGRQRSRTIHTRNTGSASCCSPARKVCRRI